MKEVEERERNHGMKRQTDKGERTRDTDIRENRRGEVRMRETAGEKRKQKERKKGR